MTPLSFLVCLGGLLIMAFLLLRHWIRSPARAVDHFIRQLEAGERPDLPFRTDYEHEILLSDSGFTIRACADEGQSTGVLPWNAITEVTAYKLDLYTTDQVRLAIVFDHAGHIEAHEEMKGFADFCEELTVRLDGFPTFWSWFPKVTTPAFETSLTRLFPQSPTTVTT